MRLKLHIGYINSHGHAVADALGINFYSPTPEIEVKLDKAASRKAVQLGLSRQASVLWSQLAPGNL